MNDYLPAIDPCPYPHTSGKQLPLVVSRYGGVLYAVKCHNPTCYAEGPWRGTQEEAIAAWNRRPQTLVEQASILRLRLLEAEVRTGYKWETVQSPNRTRWMRLAELGAMADLRLMRRLRKQIAAELADHTEQTAAHPTIIGYVNPSFPCPWDDTALPYFCCIDCYKLGEVDPNFHPILADDLDHQNAVCTSCNQPIKTGLQS